MKENNRFKEVARFSTKQKVISISATADRLFYIANSTLYSCEVHKFGLKPELLLERVNHTNVSVSPCGRAFCLYTKGRTSPEMVFSPYKECKLVRLQVNGRIREFRWGLDESLVCLTVDEKNIIRVWRECCDEEKFRCTNWYKFEHDVDFASFCIPACSDEHPQKFQAAAASNSLFPHSSSPEFPILVGTEGQNAYVLENIGLSKLDKFASFGMNTEGVVQGCVDLQTAAVKRQIHKLLTVTTLSKHALTFTYTEIADNVTTTSIPYKVTLLHSRVVTIDGNESGDVITLSEDGSVFNWSQHKKDVFPEKHIDGLTVNIRGKRIELRNQKTIVCHEAPAAISGYEVCNNCLIALAGKRIVIYRNGGFSEFEVEIETESVNRVSFHSTDLFAVSHGETLSIYFFNGKSYSCVSKLQNVDGCIPMFLPHSMVVLAVAHLDSLRFYTLNSRQLFGFKALPTTRIEAMKYISSTNSFIVATRNTLFRILLPSDFFPTPMTVTSDYTLASAISLCKFAVLEDVMDKKTPSIESFIKGGSAETFVFRDDISGMMKSFRMRLPEKWTNIDDNGMKFLFTYCLSLVHTEASRWTNIFSIWALLSRDQKALSRLLRIKSIAALRASFMPLWAKSKDILIDAISHLLSSEMPELEELDIWIMLSVIIGKRHLAAQFARSNGNERLAFFLGNPHNDNARKIERNAYEAQKQHRNALSAMFFVMREMKHQAMVVLRDDPMLQIAVGRMIDIDSWVDGVTDPFYRSWWGNKKDQAIETLSQTMTSCRTLSMELHRFCLLRELKAENRLLLLNIQNCPEMLTALLNQAHLSEQNAEKREATQTMEFSFGNWDVGDDDSFSDYSEEESEAEKVEQRECCATFETTFGDIHAHLDISKWCVSATTCEEQIVHLLADVENGNSTENTFTQLLQICKVMIEEEKLAVVRVILFIIARARGAYIWITPLIQSYCSLEYCRSMVDEFNSSIIENTNPTQSLEDLLGVALTKTDIDLLEYAAFNQLAQEISSGLGMKEISVLTAFLHHRHRLIFDNIRSYKFSAREILNDINALGIHNSDEIKRMAQTKEDEKWVLALHDRFNSPFFVDRKFISSCSYNVQFNVTHATGICINSNNNQCIAIAANQVIKRIVAQEQLDGTFLEEAQIKEVEDEWDLITNDTEEITSSGTEIKGDFQSPFSRVFLMTTPTTPRGRAQREFHSSWPSDASSSIRDVRAKCIDAHPHLELFVTGDKYGNVHLWDFGVSHANSLGSRRVCTSRLESVQFNTSGDKVLCLDAKGTVTLSDFSRETSFSIAQGNSIRWLNPDTQFVVSDPKESRFLVYDLLCDTGSPVAVFSYPKAPQNDCPLSVCNSYIAAGFDDGGVVVYDTRMSQVLCHMGLHSAPITCVTYDPSGSFFMTGSVDNSVTVVEAKTMSSMDHISGVLPNGSSEAVRSSRKRGIKSLAISNQAIVAAGYSPYVHVWTSIDSSRVVY